MQSVITIYLCEKKNYLLNNGHILNFQSRYNEKCI